jgi:homocysteine S-methyltransferase
VVPLPAWVLDPFTVIDGGLSTALAELGHRPGGELWTAQLVLDAPDVVVAAHRRYVEAGADVVITASYQASQSGFERAGASVAKARRALSSTTALARAAGARFVAASIGPFGATMADGSEYHGRYAASWDEVRAFHRARLAVLADSDPDLFAVETIPTLAEAEIVLDELARVSATPAWLACSCRSAARTCGGDDLRAVARLASNAPQVAAVGLNCSAPPDVADALDALRAACSLPLVVYTNHGGRWDAGTQRWADDAPDEPDAHVDDWVARGARLIGGCCGVGTSAIGRLAAARSAMRR